MLDACGGCASEKVYQLISCFFVAFAGNCLTVMPSKLWFYSISDFLIIEKQLCNKVFCI